MGRSRILLVGDLPELERQLQQTGYEIVMDADTGHAGERLKEEWFHLAIVQLRPISDGVDAERLALAIQANGLVPKIILSSQALDQMSRTVREALTSLERPAPAVAFVSQMEGSEIIGDVVNRAIERYIRVDRALKIEPGNDVFYTLAGWIMPETNLSQWVNELEDLFRILFQGYSRITLEFRDHLRGQRGKMAVVWVQPESDVIPREHPLLVKCGLREDIEKIREKYDRYFFRLTATRLAGFARTRHFAAIALPTLPDQPEVIHDFPTFYRSVDDEARICEVLDRLFARTCEPWRRQSGIRPACQGQDLRSLCLDRFSLRDREKLRKSIQELSERALSYGFGIELSRKEIGFRLRPREKPVSYPHPLLYLYGNQRIFELTPGQMGITHGDLRGTNLCVDAQGVVWLDGYESMDWGPDMMDVAGIETLLKFHCLESMDLRELYLLERMLLEPVSFNDPLVHCQATSLPIQKALGVVRHLRNKWGKGPFEADMQEYYALLFFFAMRELVTEDVLPSRRSPELRKLYALLSAAMICYRLEHWNNWIGFPEGKKVVLPTRSKT